MKATFDERLDMTNDTNKRVVCAAIRAADGSLLLDEDQGFVDQWGRWMSRAEAYIVAMREGQILHDRNGVGQRWDVGPVLYSEGLY
jgi:hypothetical protein